MRQLKTVPEGAVGQVTASITVPLINSPGHGLIMLLAIVEVEIDFQRVLAESKIRPGDRATTD
jgi:hypothetical protein